MYLKDIWPTNKEIADVVAASLSRDAVPQALRRGVQGPEAVAGDRGGRRHRHLSLVRRLHLRARTRPISRASPWSRRRSATSTGARILARARRLHHHRPHQPGRQHPESLARPASTCCERQVAAEGLQQLRRAPRQPRGHDARHLRQHPHQERDAARRRRRHDQALPVRRGDADLRRRHALQGGRRAAGGVRRQGIRHRLLARLGGQGHACCWA